MQSLNPFADDFAPDYRGELEELRNEIAELRDDLSCAGARIRELEAENRLLRDSADSAARAKLLASNIRAVIDALKI